jgi:hypothetical protein
MNSRLGKQQEKKQNLWWHMPVGEKCHAKIIFKYRNLGKSSATWKLNQGLTA